MSKLAGFADEDLHPQVVEALKVLDVRHADYAAGVSRLDTQYLKPLAAAHDGTSDECLDVLAQVAAVRALF